MTAATPQYLSIFGCREIDGQDPAGLERWRLKRLLEDYGNVLSRMSLAHLSQTQPGLRLVEAELFDGARRDLKDCVEALNDYVGLVGHSHASKHLASTQRLLGEAIELMDNKMGLDRTPAIQRLSAASYEMQCASAVAGEAVFDMSACCGGNSNHFQEFNDGRRVRLGA